MLDDQQCVLSAAWIVVSHDKALLVSVIAQLETSQKLRDGFFEHSGDVGCLVCQILQAR